MGLKDRIKRRLNRHGGPSGVLKAALGRKTSDPTESESTTPLSSYAAATAELPDGADAEGFVAVATRTLVQDGRPSTFAVHGKNIAVYQWESSLYAIDSACSHEDGPLGESDVEDGVITCPYHDWRFELKNGHCITDPSRPVATYAIKEVDGFIWIGEALSQGTSRRGGEHDDGMEMR